MEQAQDHLWFLESMDRVNRALQSTNDLDEMMSRVLDAVLEILDCDRAWLVYPCDPDAPTWRALMERTRPEYPGTLELGMDIPRDPYVAAAMAAELRARGPLMYGPGYDSPLPPVAGERFRVRSAMAMALRPRVDKPWSFGVHQCSHDRIWTTAEQRLIQEIGRRLEDALTSLIAVRDLRESDRQKMEAIGRLAGRVAHDFNNLLMVINANSELLAGRLGDDEDALALASEIRTAGDRAARLTRQLLAFSRNQLLHPEVVNVNELLGGVHEMLRRVIGEDIELILDVDESVGLTKVDPSQFEHAIINLAVNARDAMPNGGRLTIATGERELADESHGVDLAPGRYVAVAVSDSGRGFDEAARAHIFEPFFTTKEAGQGTGFGLAMVYGFVKQSGGDIEIESEPGRGSTFTIYLPLAEDRAPAPAPTPQQAKPESGSETVLLVEDEDDVRELVKHVLESHGYTVLEARDPDEALRLSAEHDHIDMLLTDLVMPRMNGPALAASLSKERPQLRLLFMSGYMDDAMLRQAGLGARPNLLEKPFDTASLARKVREVLDAQPV